MAYTEQFLARKYKYEKKGPTFKASVRDMLLGCSATFAPLPASMVFSAYLGFKAAKDISEINSALQPLSIDKRYLPTKIGDLEFQDGILLGLGMELGEFKDWVQYAQEKREAPFSQDESIEYYAKMLKSFSPTMLIDDLLTRHLAFSAQTGSGKTELMFSTADQQIARGGGMIIFEAKGKEGDVGAIEKITALAEQHGRLDDVEYFSMDDAENCFTWNPWVSKDARALISMAMALQPTDGDRYFRDMNKYGLTAAILALRFQQTPKPFCFKDLMAIFSDPDVLIKLHQKMSTSTAESKNAKTYVSAVLTFFVSADRQGNSFFNREMYQSRFSGLAATVGNFCHSEYSEILNSLNPDINIKNSIVNNKITIISVSTLGDREGVSTLGQIFMADLARAIGEILKEGSKPVIPCITWLDEYPSFKSVTHQPLFQLVRAANVGLVISFQGINFLKEESETFARNVLGNTWNVLFSDIKDPETRKEAADLGNTVVNMFKMEQKATSSGKSHTSEQSGMAHNKSQSLSTTNGYKGQRETLIQPEDLFLEAGDALLIGKRQVIKLRMPLVEFSKPLKTMKEYKLTKFDDRKNVGDELWSKDYDRSFAQFTN